MKQKRPSRGSLAVLYAHSGQLENYSDDLIWRLDRVGSYTDDILNLVDDYGEAFTRELNADDLRRLGRLVNEGLSDDVVDAVIRHVDYFAGYSDDAIKKIAESGCNAERILTQMDNYAKDFTEDLTAGQLKRLDDILEQGITQEQFEVLLKHGKQLDDYTYEVIGLWGDYAGNGDVISNANGNISIIERELGFPEGYFSNQGGLVRIDIDDISGLNIRMPSGNETGANKLWLSEGYTSGGVPEAITDIIPLSRTKITKISVD